ATYADLSMFQLIEGLRYAFPLAMKRIERDVPGIVEIHGRVAARPGIEAYLASPRRIAFNEMGIFRHYPELDGGAGAAKISPVRRAFFHQPSPALPRRA